MKNISLAMLFFYLFLNSGLIWSKQINTVPLKYGVLSVSKPSKVLATWQPLADYLESILDRKVNVVAYQDYQKFEQAVLNNGIDLLYINSLVHYRLAKQGSVTPIVQIENTEGKIYSFSKFLVRKDSGIRSAKDLSGKKLAYISAINTGGYLAPRAYLTKSGVETEEVFTNNVANSIHKVLLGEVDAATMCGISYKLMRRKIQTGDLKVIATSEKYPENVIATRAGFSDTLKQQISEILVKMDSKSEGRRILDGMKSAKINRFVSYAPEVEKVLQKLIREASLN